VRLEQRYNIRNGSTGYIPHCSNISGNALHLVGVAGAEVSCWDVRDGGRRKVSDCIATGGQVVRDMCESSSASPISDAGAAQGPEETVMSVEKRQFEEADRDTERFAESVHGGVGGAGGTRFELAERRRGQSCSIRDLGLAGPAEITSKT
jgi:hypothetical protein